MTAVRRVPIHPELVRLGFLEYAEELKRKDDKQIFPELQRGGPDRRLGFYLSKKFGTYRKQVGLKRRLVDLHALRANFSTAMKNAGIPEGIKNDLMGHEGESMAGRYDKETYLPVLKQAVDKVRYEGLDVSQLRR